MKYIIEVQKNESGEYEHVGYINNTLSSLSETRKYIKKYNPHLRINGNKRKGFYTTTDQLTNMRFLIRSYRNERLNLRPF